MQNVNYFTKTRGIIQNTCCCLFSTDLNKIFHIKYVYIQYSPQEKIIVEFIKITPFKSLHTLDSVLLPEWSTAVFFCLVIVVHESLVCPDQLNCLLFFRKILQVPQILCFSSIFVYLNPFQQWLYDFEIHLFTLRTTEGLICNYYRRFKRSLMLQKEKPCIKRGGGLLEFLSPDLIKLTCFFNVIHR